jgi:hypothetical protein
MEVACRQLGFTGGEWYFWHLHLNDTVQMLYEEPGKGSFTLATLAAFSPMVKTRDKCSFYKRASWIVQGTLTKGEGSVQLTSPLISVSVGDVFKVKMPAIVTRDSRYCTFLGHLGWRETDRTWTNFS